MTIFVCTHYDFVIEAGNEVFIMLQADSAVFGKFTAWQEPPLEKEFFAFSILFAGLIGTVVSFKQRKQSR